MDAQRAIGQAVDAVGAHVVRDVGRAEQLLLGGRVHAAGARARIAQKQLVKRNKVAVQLDAQSLLRGARQRRGRLGAPHDATAAPRRRRDQCTPPPCSARAEQSEPSHGRGGGGGGGGTGGGGAGGGGAGGGGAGDC